MNSHDPIWRATFEKVCFEFKTGRARGIQRDQGKRGNLDLLALWVSLISYAFAVGSPGGAPSRAPPHQVHELAEVLSASVPVEDDVLVPGRVALGARDLRDGMQCTN